MPAPSQKSIVNEKGKYLQAGDAVRFGAEKGAFVASDRAARDRMAEAATAGGVKGKLKVAPAPSAAIDRIEKAATKAKAAKANAAAPRKSKPAAV